MLLNYAVAHRCVAHHASSTELEHSTARCQIEETAFHIFQLAQSGATKWLLPSTNQTLPPKTILLVSLVTTANLLHMSSSSQELHNQYYEDLADVLGIIAEVEMLCPLKQAETATAA